MSGSKARTHRRHVAPAERRKRWWRRPAIWLGGVTTAVILPVLINVLSNVLTVQAQRVATQPSVNTPGRPMPARSSIVARREAATPSASPTPSGPPLTIVSEDPISDTGSVWVFPGKYLATLRARRYLASANNATFSQWFFARGAYPTAVDMQLVVQNDRSYPIRIIDMSVIKHCQSPLRGTLYYSPSAGADDDVRLGFNLNSPDTEAEAAKGWTLSHWRPNYFAGYTVSLKPGTQQVFDIRAVISDASCTFRIGTTLLDDEKKVFQVIDDDGQPFRLTSIASPFGYSKLDFRYEALYAGGIASPDKTGIFVRENPATYNP